MSHRGRRSPHFGHAVQQGSSARIRGSAGGAEEEEDMMRLATYLHGLALILGGLIVLSACTVVVDEPGPRPVPGPGPGFCSREFRPVCAGRFGEQRTFNNSCLADRAGWRVIHRGECRRGGGGGGERVCTMDYRPVCAMRRGNFRTFGNACQADAAGWRIVRNRPC
jgi:hypothetical protein